MESVQSPPALAARCAGPAVRAGLLALGALALSGPAAADVTPPTASITSPGGGETVFGGIAFAADASDDTGVVGVQFLLDGSPLGAEDLAAPYTLPWNSASVGNGSHTVAAQARDAAGHVTDSSPVTFTVLNDGSPAQIGQWGPVLSWPIVAIHASLLPDGRVLVWDAWEPEAQALIWSPASGTFATAYSESGIFCAGHAFDANGALVVTGGHPGGHDPTQDFAEYGIVDVNRFDASTATWSRGPDLRFPRWYPTTLPLADGRILTLSGNLVPDDWADTPEVYDPAAGTWHVLPQVDTRNTRTSQYPRAHLLPDGSVYVFNPADGGLRRLDPADETWDDLGANPQTNASTVLFRPGRLLMTGGRNRSESAVQQPKAMVLDASQSLTDWRLTTPMAYGRIYHNLVMLPDGRVLAVGGRSSFDDGTEILPAEQWDPDTEAWTTLAALQDPRMYHSTALLLPDGRVLTTGGGRISGLTDYLTAQIYSPPYLYRGPRPTITTSPAEVAYGTAFTVATPQAAQIAGVSLLPLGSVTHTINPNGRFLSLPFTVEPGEVVATSPAAPALAPPGYYLLFLLNEAGAPSVGRMVRLVLPDAPAPPVRAFLEEDGQVVMEAEHYEARMARNGQDWTVTTEPIRSFSRSGYVTVPDEGQQYSTGYEATSPELIFNVRFNTTGTYHVWVRGQGDDGGDDSCHAGLDGVGPASADKITGFKYPAWIWKRGTMDQTSATLEVPTPGLHTVHLWLREDGLRVDRLLLRTSSSSTGPSGKGPGESPRVSVSFEPDATPPVISDAGASAVASTTATIAWTTDEPATSEVAYGTTPAYDGGEAGAGGFSTAHAVPVTGLAPETLYYYEIASMDPSGNEAEAEGTFTTAAAPAYAAFLESGGQVVMEAEHADQNLPRSGVAWVEGTAKSGYAGEGYLQALPNSGSMFTVDYVADAPALTFNVEFSTVGTYYVWIRGHGDSGNDDSCHAGLDGAGPASADKLTGFNSSGWVWKRGTSDGPAATLEITAPGLHTIHLWPREDGIKVDRVLLRTSSSSTAPSGKGPAESPRSQ
jgi:hypothetical protein